MPVRKKLTSPAKVKRVDPVAQTLRKHGLIRFYPLIPTAVATRAKAAAELLGLTLGDVTAEALNQYLDQIERERGISLAEGPRNFGQGRQPTGRRGRQGGKATTK